VESKEAIAGFFLVRAENLEQAVEIGKGCPSLGFGQTVEVRAMVTEPHELQVAREKKSGLQQAEAQPDPHFSDSRDRSVSQGMTRRK
jgi:hypothetical protein